MRTSLTNIAGGNDSGDRGAMHAQEIIQRYSAEPAVLEHRASLISVNRSAAETSLYEATRFSPGRSAGDALSRRRSFLPLSRA